MPQFTILIPTFDHQDTIEWAIRSVLDQRNQDFELFVVGDGAPQRTTEIVNRLMCRDARIRYFANPKDPAQGEIYRHHALAEAKGEYVCYLSDDDLWLPEHLDVMAEGLADSDFVHTIHTGVSPEGEIYALSGDYAQVSWRKRIQAKNYTLHGLSFAGHKLASYHELPYGWRPRPLGTPCDVHMWRQWLAQPDVKFRTVSRVTGLHFDAPPRRDWSVERRVDELCAWFGRSRESSFASWLGQQVLAFHQRHSRREEQILELVDVCSEAGALAKAAELLEEIIECNQREWRHFKSLADIYLTQGRVSRALALLDQALCLFPAVRHVYSFYGEVLFTHGRHQQALSIFERATELPNTDYDDFLRLAKAQIELGADHDAIAVLSIGGRKFPEIADFADLLSRYQINSPDEDGL
ncbi:glycosyltransferase [Halioglobus maricola]|uniref:glycosyltransferase n=1 Tax=Halioglobus maricola TaxID=2601894 RepID=UPI001478A9D8|nr:glycosyltransferase [Halioglobus maricola]